MSARRLLTLIAGLPPTSAFHRAIDPKSWAWTWTEELLAGLIETVDVTNRILLKVNSQEGSHDPEPIHVPRPWDPPPRMATAEEMKAFFGSAAIKVQKKVEE